MLVTQKPIYRSITENDYSAMSGPNWPSYREFSSGVDIEQFIADELDSMLNNVADKKSKITNFCVMPFYGWEYPANTHCCLLPNGYDIDTIKTDMLNNRRTAECHKCWTIEDAGLISDRQIKNATLDYYSDIDIVQLYERCLINENKTAHYQIAASNFCNATCVTCGSGSSSAWGELLTTKKTIPLVDRASINNVDYAHAEFVGFKGGESTMIRAHWDIVEQLIEHDNCDCLISFTTNGSFDLTDRQKSLLNQFKNVNFNFSIDGVGLVFEYMRYPISWRKLIDNVAWAEQQGFYVSASYTISNLNIMYYDQTVGWFNENRIRYVENPVYDPVFFAPRSLSASLKKQISASTDSALVHRLLSQHSTVDDSNYAEFLKQIQLQDQLKHIHIQDYLPEFWNLTQSA
jgi:hypothetical protein